jgi:hypothetical protein
MRFIGRRGNHGLKGRETSPLLMKVLLVCKDIPCIRDEGLLYL